MNINAWERGGWPRVPALQPRSRPCLTGPTRAPQGPPRPPGKGQIFLWLRSFSQATSLLLPPEVPGPYSCLHMPGRPTSEPLSPDCFSLWGLPGQRLPGSRSLDVASCPPPVPPACFLDGISPFALGRSFGCSLCVCVSLSEMPILQAWAVSGSRATVSLRCHLGLPGAEVPQTPAL